MIVYTHAQGTPEWIEARRAVITASRFRDCRDRLKKTGEPSKDCRLYAQDIARERCGGTAPAKFQNAAMRMGTEQEPLARLAYEAETGNVVIEAGFICTDDRMFGVSVDGLVGDDGVVEFKTMVSSETLFKAVANGDISDYLDQCYGALWLLGRQWVDLCLWAPDLEGIGRHLTIHHITRDEDAIQALEDDLIAFAAMVRKNEQLLRVNAPELLEAA